MKAGSLIIDRVLKLNNVYVFCSFLFFYFYPIIKFIYDNRQHQLILDTRIALFLGALALKMELVKLMFFVRFFFCAISYHAPFGAQRLSLYTTRAEGPSLTGSWPECYLPCSLQICQKKDFYGLRLRVKGKGLRC